MLLDIFFKEKNDWQPLFAILTLYKYISFNSDGINFVKVDDITIVEDENGVDMPYIYKNNEFIELYIE